jgi:putative transcriptional regulator
MDKKLFERLAESMGQMDEIVRGVRAPSREICMDAVKSPGLVNAIHARSAAVQRLDSRKS